MEGTIKEEPRGIIVSRAPWGLEEANTVRGWRIRIQLIKIPEAPMRNQSRKVKGKKRTEVREKAHVGGSSQTKNGLSQVQ